MRADDIQSELAAVDLATLFGVRTPGARAGFQKSRTGLLSEWLDDLVPLFQDEDAFLDAIDNNWNSASRLLLMNFVGAISDRNNGNYATQDGELVSLDHESSGEGTARGYEDLPKFMTHMTQEDELVRAMQTFYPDQEIPLNQDEVRRASQISKQYAQRLADLEQDRAARMVRIHAHILQKLAQTPYPTFQSLVRLASNYSWYFEVPS